ncbi:hypothetical protein CPB85DRAFT_1330396 [Mucidula mucida]|nr:hypothetical protein CPB85DRAFT_1330396 [Mucidula mucida]
MRQDAERLVCKFSYGGVPNRTLVLKIFIVRVQCPNRGSMSTDRYGWQSTWSILTSSCVGHVDVPPCSTNTSASSTRTPALPIFTPCTAAQRIQAQVHGPGTCSTPNLFQSTPLNPQLSTHTPPRHPPSMKKGWGEVVASTYRLTQSSCPYGEDAPCAVTYL